VLRDLSPLQIVLAILGVGLLIAWHELGHYALARLLHMRVLKYSIGFGPKVWGKKIGEIEYQVAALPLGGFVQIKGMTSLEPGVMDDERSFVRRPRWARFLVLAAGPGFNYMMAAAFFFAYAWFWPSPLPHNVIEIGEVSPGMPAEQAGMKGGDLVIAVDGAPPETVAGFKQSIAKRNGEAIGMSVLRGDERLELTITPQKVGEDLRIGVAPALRAPRASLVASIGGAVMSCHTVSVNTLAALSALVKRQPGVDVQSPVMIVAEMKEQIDRGGRFFILLLGILSVNLGLFNLLPIPSLDGIKMLFLTIEGAIRRDLNAAAQVWVNAIGLFALLGLMAVLMVRDTLNLFS
jgi:regulator of sigma E protease